MAREIPRVLPLFEFDPAVNSKQIVLGMRGVVESVLLPPLVASLEQQAPLLQFSSVRVPRRDMESELASGRLDLAFDVLLPMGLHCELGS